MAVYRSDQAQLTFASEVAQGGDVERLHGASVTGASYLLAANTAEAGDTSITVAAGASYVVGDFIRIGDTSGAGINSGVSINSEVRKIEHKIGNTLYLDRPLAFRHQGAAATNAVGSVSSSFQGN